MDILAAGSDPTPPRPMAQSTPLPTAADLAAFAPHPVATGSQPQANGALVSQHAHEPTPPVQLATSTPLPGAHLAAPAPVPMPQDPPFSSGGVHKGEPLGSPDRQGPVLLPPATRVSPPRASARQSSLPAPPPLPALAESPFIAPRRQARAPPSLVRQSADSTTWHDNLLAAEADAEASFQQLQPGHLHGNAGEVSIGELSADGRGSAAADELLGALADSVGAGGEAGMDDYVVLGESFTGKPKAAGQRQGGGVVTPATKHAAAHTGAASPNENADSNGM
jgi:hypothetical protein